MIILDGHIHIFRGPKDAQDFVQRLNQAGIAGGIIISLPPAAFPVIAGEPSAARRMNDVLQFTQGSPDWHPFFWIDPMEADAIDQAREAAARGVAGFKIICHSYPPGDPRALRLYRVIAELGKPLLFHSGILWNGAPSSEFNRPVAFEPLLQVEGLRFCLAHLAWPWCDELIAVYGKFLNAYGGRPDLSCEMFLDLTPGTPPIYRREALTKLFSVGYDVADNVIFGTDGNVGDYHPEWARQWLERDGRIYDELELSAAVREKIHAGNMQRFLGLKERTAKPIALKPGE